MTDNSCVTISATYINGAEIQSVELNGAIHYTLFRPQVIREWITIGGERRYDSAEVRQ